MLYLNLMRSPLPLPRSAVLFLLGLALILGHAAANPLSLSSQPSAFSPPVQATPTTPSEAGSTNGIVLLAAFIVMIVIVPIIWHLYTWSRQQ